MNVEDLTVLSDGADQFHQQWSTGEWSGSAKRDWVSWTWPCGRVRCMVCDPEKSGRARRAVVWSQVMAAPDLPFGRVVSR